jgi:hypothetical protein
MPTTVVHCQVEEYDVYIGRPSEWGNPFTHKDYTIAKYKVGSREEAVAKFEAWFLSQPDLVEKARRKLRGKILGCWCHPQSCHGDIIAKIVDGMGP